MNKIELLTRMKDLISLNPSLTREMASTILKVNSIHIYKYWYEAGGNDDYVAPTKTIKKKTRIRYIKDRNKEIIRKLIDDNIKRVDLVKKIIDKTGLSQTTVYLHLKTIKKENYEKV